MKKTRKRMPGVKGAARRIWADEKEYEYHPLSARFPMMEGQEFEDLADDIAANGQKETVKLLDGKILDGRDRYRGCRDRKIPCWFENWNGEGDPRDYVLSMNLHRRHLTPEARQALVIELRKEGKSIRQIADTIHTSVGSVHRALASVPNGTVGTEQLPTTIKGKDKKLRQSRRPKGKPPKPSKTNGNANAATGEGETTKGRAPKIADLVGIIHRGLAAAEEAEQLAQKGNAVFFRFNG
jgi:hypothetical protein